MATTIATLEAKLHADTRNFDKNMGKSESTFSKVGRNMGKIALGAGIAIAAGLAVGAKKSIEAASDLEEQINKTSVVFEGSAKQVQEWSKHLTRSFGLSQRAALEAAGTYGNMLKPMGIMPGKAAAMSQKMVELAGDMASFNNASPEETLDALASGIAGQTEPLRRFGVFLDVARVKQEAVRLGLIKATDELTPAAKAQATYSLIVKDTADAQGDFARTSKSLPNLLRTIKGTLENLAARIGQKLLPMVAAAVGAFEELLNFIDRVTAAKDLTLSIKIIWEGLKTLGGNLFEAVQKMLLGSAGTLKPLKLDSGKIIEFERVGASSGLVVSLQKMFETIDWARIGRRIGEAIGDAIEISTEWVGKALDEASSWIDSHSGEIGALGVKIILEMLNKLTDPAFWKDNWQLILGVALSVFPVGKGLSIGGKLAAAIMRPLARLLPTGLGRIAARAIDEIGHQFRRLPPLVQEVFRRLASVALVALGAIVRYMRGRFKAAWDALPGWVQKALKVAGRLIVFVSVFNQIRDAVQFVIDKVRQLIDAIGDLISKIPDIPSIRLPSPGDLNPFNAAGTSNWRGGATWVGERGPELVNLPQGSRVYSNGVSSAMAGGGGGTTIIVNVPASAMILDAGKLVRYIDEARRTYGRRGGA